MDQKHKKLSVENRMEIKGKWRDKLIKLEKHKQKGTTTEQNKEPNDQLSHQRRMLLQPSTECEHETHVSWSKSAAHPDPALCSSQIDQYNDLRQKYKVCLSIFL